jgi:hypothetical protein
MSMDGANSVGKRESGCDLASPPLPLSLVVKSHYLSSFTIFMLTKIAPYRIVLQ